MRPTPGSRQDYVYFAQHSTRWNDNDLYGHLNNAVHHTLLDSTVNAWALEHGVIDMQNGTTFAVIAENGCRYFAELRYPQKITVGVRIAHMGRSSLRYELALFGDDDEIASAEAFFVQVYIDRLSRRPVPIPDAHQPILKTLMREVSS